MNIVFDNIIYSLQRSGGGSVYWTELIKRFNSSKENIEFYDHENDKDNFFRQELKLRNTSKETKFPFGIRRYLPFTEEITEKSIFHSSYYRYSNSKNAINVTTVHDFTTEYYRTGLARWVHFQQKKQAIKKSEGIVCISENTKKDLLKFHPWAANKKIKVINNGVSDDFFKIENEFNLESIDERFKKFTDKKLLIFIGHRTSYKNFDKAVEAYSNLNHPDYHFLIIGEALNESEHNLLNEKLKQDSYTVLSGINNFKLNHLYNKAFCLIYPSSYEGFGIPLIEAMKTGLPVIASKNSSIPEVAGEAGVLLDNLDENSINQEIIKLEDSTYRSMIIEKGWVQAKKFNWDKTFEQYHQFYKELYDGK
ncbi:glycosyltransferase family 1 protein [uncultured Chryseobacterium sp.]|uniref:glycosyltransferase family 4 protein n=1 Tax=uncultured Chryseobacterium sp. TaxID=259322 RepID=UPI0026240DC3|nr:glycosyltransferase family 1 protein [uncultured Chryseobacterium sp.]